MKPHEIEHEHQMASISQSNAQAYQMAANTMLIASQNILTAAQIMAEAMKAVRRE